MYSKKIEEFFRKSDISVGDRIAVSSVKGEFEGLLMPRVEGEQDVLVIKLDNGYNIGIGFGDSKIKLIEKMKARKAPPKQEKTDGEVAILGCGGTIASKIEYRTGAVYPAITPEELRMTFPDIGKIAGIRSKSLFSLFSEDMNAEHWKIVADAVADEIKDGVEGAVVMHGTDTMGYTAAALSFMLQNLPIPVVLVGAQRSSDRPSSENEMNMLNAVYCAKKDIGEVGVCMHAGINDDFCHLHRGTRVRKMHSSRRDAFRSINSPPIAVVDWMHGRFEALTEYKKRSPAGSLQAKTKINDNVAMVYVHPNIKTKLIESLSGYDGVVLVGTGLGHAPSNPFNDKRVHSVLPAIKGLVDSGIPVVMSSQTISGRLCMRVYTTGRLLMEAGVIGDGADWLPETAYAKLCWVLGQTKDAKKAKELMMTNLAGEISGRSPMMEEY
ncbi:Glu-tRNA(Gln) amidotransferase subunit GatD [Candidatus Micrarchaeota archaeon]|nr:Glu-tRNA(Gln) amidotransferase subunit GatD [Candidatus Micrarchaeota archaeon]